MSNLATLQSQLNEINTKRVRLQTLKEQAVKQCEEIQKKYNVSSLEELDVLFKKAQTEYNEQVALAQEYITTTNQQLAQYTGII